LATTAGDKGNAPEGDEGIFEDASIIEDMSDGLAQASHASVAGSAGSGVDALRDAAERLTYDGDRSSEGHVGAAMRRGFVEGGEDPRDAELAERIDSEELAWRGRIFTVDRLGVTLPDGRHAVRDVVRHNGAVAIVALTDDGRICLVRQFRTALGRVTVEIPAGKLDPGEDPLDCAVRELREETGLVAERMAYLTTIATSAGFSDELVHLYMATGLSQASADPDADEFINVDLVALDEFVDAVLDGRIEDSKTVIGALVCDSVAHRLQPPDDAPAR
jgi:ADP-ribose pyrophosphatase